MDRTSYLKHAPGAKLTGAAVQRKCIREEDDGWWKQHHPTNSAKTEIPQPTVVFQLLAGTWPEQFLIAMNFSETPHPRRGRFRAQSSPVAFRSRSPVPLC